MPQFFGQKRFIILLGSLALLGIALDQGSGVWAQGLSNYLHFPGKSIPGRNIDISSNQTAQSCAAKCDANAQCKSFDLHPNGDCFLQDANRDDVSLADSGTYDYYERRSGTGGGQSIAGYLHFPGKSIPGRNIDISSNQTPQSCGAKCDANSNCKSFDLHPDGDCFLQDANREDVSLSNSNTYDYYERVGRRASASTPQRPTRDVSAERGDQVARIWNSAGCSYTDTSQLQLDGRTRINRLDLWYNWAAGETSTSYEIVSSGGSVVQRGSLARLSCDPYQRSWCVAGDNPGVTLPAGNYRVRVPRERVCQNSASNGRGFIQAWGDVERRVSTPADTARAPSRQSKPAGLAGFVCVLDYTMPGRNIRSLTGQTHRSCAIECQNEAGCKSYDIDSAGTCYLQNADSDDVNPVASDTYDFCEPLSG